ncbi:MAG: NAD(P)-binding domain-containing protein, partial [Bdellovibrionota bacterium]
MITMSSKKIAFLGTGKLNQALIKGLQKTSHPYTLAASVRSQGSLDTLSRTFPSLAVTLNNTTLLQDARYVVLGVKPQHALELVKSLRADFAEGATLISLCARLPLDRLRGALGDAKVQVLRLMPNTACETGHGLLGISTEKNVALSEDLSKLFSLLGKTQLIEEKDMDAFTVLGACTPAFFL